MRRIWLILLAPFFLLGLLAIGIVAAQDPASKPTGRPRMDPTVKAEVDRAVARAETEGLPTEPLIHKALEGTAKGAPPPRIIKAVTTLASGLSTAKAELGSATAPADLVAGAEALRAGVQPAALATLRRARPRESLLTPLVVLADLISRGVPPVKAADAVLELAGRAATDADFNAIQQAVQRDIDAGAPPAEAVAVRSGSNGRGAGSAGGKPAKATPPRQPKPPKHTAGDRPPGAPDPPRAQPPRAKPPKAKPPKGPPKGKPLVGDRSIPDRP